MLIPSEQLDRYTLLFMGPNNAIATMDVNVTVHGFRASFRNWCAVNKFDFTASELCLAHTVGNETVRAYLRDDLLEERRAIMDEWAKFCCSGVYD